MWLPPDFSCQILSAFAVVERQGRDLCNHRRAGEPDLDTAAMRDRIAPHVTECDWRPQMRGEGRARDLTGLPAVLEDPRASGRRPLAVDPQPDEPPVYVTPRRSALNDL